MYRDRAEAGQLLGRALEPMIIGHPVVLGLPRGGVPVAAEVAKVLDAPLDVIVVRKLGVPAQPELAMGAIGEDDVRVLNHDIVSAVGADIATIEAVERRERAELVARATRFRGVRPRVPITGRTAVVVDDGIATGSTARAAVLVARAHGATRVVLAVPVGPRRTCTELRDVADDVLCLDQPATFSAVGQFYRDFRQTTDDEVIACLTGERA